MSTLLPRQILSVNTALATPLEIDGRRVLSGIGKRAVSTPADPQRIGVQRMGLTGDEQADLTVHGGLSKAVYAYPHEHYAFWQTVRAQTGAQAWDEALPHGMLGENLTLQGLLEGDMWIGDYLRLPRCTLAISEPRSPCFKFNDAMGFNQASKLMMQSGYCGAYLSVIDTGTVEAGDEATLVPGPREVNLRELFQARRERR